MARGVSYVRWALQLIKIRIVKRATFPTVKSIIENMIAV